MQNILEVRDLGRSYVNFRLEHISFSIAGGTIMGLVGENGAGKSTTIRGILGLIRRECGEVLFCGEPLNTDSVAMKEQIGVVFDSLCFSPELTVEKAGKICRSIYSNWNEAYFQELLQQFSLLPKQKVKELSRGMSMKLSLVLAFAHHPKLLILDEPTSGLDPGERVRFRNLISTLAENRIVILSTHIVSDVEYIAKEILIMKNGELLHQGSAETILQPIQSFVWECDVTRQEVDSLEKNYVVANLKHSAGAERLRIISEVAPCKTARNVEPTLEDLYLYYFAEVSDNE